MEQYSEGVYARMGLMSGLHIRQMRGTDRYSTGCTALERSTGRIGSWGLGSDIDPDKLVGEAEGAAIFVGKSVWTACHCHVAFDASQLSLSL